MGLDGAPDSEPCVFSHQYAEARQTWRLLQPMAQLGKPWMKSKPNEDFAIRYADGDLAYMWRMLGPLRPMSDSSC